MGPVTGSEILARALKAQGMDTLFFLMGGPMLETESELVRLGTKMIDTRHEQAAAVMAHARTRLAGKPGAGPPRGAPVRGRARRESRASAAPPRGRARSTCSPAWPMP